MKSKLLLTLASALIAATTAYAEQMKADIPFEFSVGQTVLPAGRYTFDTDLSRDLLRVRSEDSRRTVLILTNSAATYQNQEQAMVVFHRYEATYFLSQVRPPGNHGQNLRRTSRETKLALSAPGKNETLLALK